MGLGHSVCRQHADCKEVKPDGEVIWNPDSCDVCLALADIAFEKPATKKEKQRALKSLKRWAKGFQKNRPGKPFLNSEKWRARVFPKGGPEAIWKVSSTTFRPIQKIPEEVSSSAGTSSVAPRATSCDTLEAVFTESEDVAMEEVHTPTRVEEEALLHDSESELQDSDDLEEDRASSSSGTAVAEPVMSLSAPTKKAPLITIKVQLPKEVSFSCWCVIVGKIMALLRFVYIFVYSYCNDYRDLLEVFFKPVACFSYYNHELYIELTLLCL